jgi:hypothetical protein
MSREHAWMDLRQISIVLLRWTVPVLGGRSTRAAESTTRGQTTAFLRLAPRLQDQVVQPGTHSQ